MAQQFAKTGPNFSSGNRQEENVRGTNAHNAAIFSKKLKMPIPRLATMENVTGANAHNGAFF